MKSDKTLSILIDESGDFGKFDSKDPNYHVVMVIHEQQDDITDRVKTFNRTLNDRGYSNHYIHVGPLIRREKPYLEFERQERRSLSACLTPCLSMLNSEKLCQRIMFCCR